MNSCDFVVLVKYLYEWTPRELSVKVYFYNPDESKGIREVSGSQ